MRHCASTRVLYIAVAIGCFSIAAGATPSLAQGVYPASGNFACGVGAAAPGPCAYSQACESPMAGALSQCCEPCCDGPCWSFAAEGIALQRSTTRNQRLFVNAPQTFNLLNAADMEFPVEYGPKISATRYGVFGSKYDVEVAYFQVGDFESNRYVSESAFMVTDVNSAYLASGSTARYRSGLYVGEVNVRWQCSDRLTLFSGFRMCELNEQYLAQGSHVRPSYPVSVEVNAHNHLYGYQLGAEGEVLNWCRFRLNALCKAGAFGNFADQNNTRVGSSASSGALSATNQRVSFLGEVGVTGTYAITKRLAVRASYGAMWLEGVALAPEQLGTSNFAAGTAKVDLDGGVFYHGGGLGFEYRF